MKYSIVIPVYKNEGSIPRLLHTLNELSIVLGKDNIEVVFVVDGSPDNSFLLLHQALPQLSFAAQLLCHSRNFGSFSAIRTGLLSARGEFFGVMAADLQEPPELMCSFFKELETGKHDIIIGAREKREDPFLSQIASTLFWNIYRRMIVKEMPHGGVDVFGCNRAFCDQLLKLDESRSSLIALIFWLGFRRKIITYTRLSRLEGNSAWSFQKKCEYMMDSIFAFTDLPIRILIRVGIFGTVFSSIFALVVFIAKISGHINVDGYATLTIIIILFGMLNFLAFGLVGTYAWRSYENSKRRPLAIILSKEANR